MFAFPAICILRSNFIFNNMKKKQLLMPDKFEITESLLNTPTKKPIEIYACFEICIVCINFAKALNYKTYPISYKLNISTRLFWWYRN